MNKIYNYRPKGVCSKEMEFTIDDDNTLIDFRVVGGCDGNLKGIKNLMIGRKVDDIATALEGIDCHHKGTSCPDQISKALKEFLENQED